MLLVIRIPLQQGLEAGMGVERQVPRVRLAGGKKPPEPMGPAFDPAEPVPDDDLDRTLL
jgi:hypothetical protein